MLYNKDMAIVLYIMGYYSDDGECERRCGLTYEIAKKAIEILNGNE